MAKTVGNEGRVEIQRAKIVTIVVQIRGTAPLVQNKFSHKAKQKMMDGMSTAARDKKTRGAGRTPRDFNDDFVQAQHLATEGWHGLPCSGFRAAMIDACRATGLPMTRAKMSVFVIADGIDKDDGTPLVRLHAPKAPERLESLVRNDNGGADVRIRPMWREWGCKVRIKFDEDMISAESVVNLLDRAGQQVGVGEGRPFSKDSIGQGWGTFEVVEKGEDSDVR